MQIESQSTINRPTYAEVDFKALSHNLKVMRRALTAGTRLLAVIKANAYGHGLLPVAKQLEKWGVDYFGVVHLPEALQLRAAGISTPILLMAGLPTAAYAMAGENQLSVAVVHWDELAKMQQASQNQAWRLQVHIKIDTGMQRLGIPYEQFIAAIAKAPEYPNLEITGIFSHLANSDNLHDHFAEEQLQRFLQATAALQQRFPHLQCIRHLANSDGTFRHDSLHLDMVRPGIALYGYSKRAPQPLQPVLKLCSSILQIKQVATGESVGYDRNFIASRPSRIAVVPLGYADGFSRAYAGSCAMVRGVLVPVVGRICMDMLMLDVTAVADVAPGDVLEFLGGTSAQLSAFELARLSATTHYQVLTSLQERVLRHYVT